jgi:hypothetical protein
MVTGAGLRHHSGLHDQPHLRRVTLRPRQVSIFVERSSTKECICQPPPQIGKWFYSSYLALAHTQSTKIHLLTLSLMCVYYMLHTLCCGLHIFSIVFILHRCLNFLFQIKFTILLNCRSNACLLFFSLNYIYSNFFNYGQNLWIKWHRETVKIWYFNVLSVNYIHM